jgi:hypothetical protein
LPHSSELQNKNSAVVFSLPVCSNSTDTNEPVISTVDVSAVGICKGEAGCLVDGRIGSGEGTDENENEG